MKIEISLTDLVNIELSLSSAAITEECQADRYVLLNLPDIAEMSRARAERMRRLSEVVRKATEDATGYTLTPVS